MTQTWTDNVFQADHNVYTDMQNIEDNLNTLKSNFSGSGTPSNPIEGQTHFNTTNLNLKVYTSSMWMSLLQGNTTTKMWIYANTAPIGWVLATGFSDTILACQGGSNAYNVAGGNKAGSWTIPTHTHTYNLLNHVHAWMWLYGEMGTYNSSGSPVGFGSGSGPWNGSDYWAIEKTYIKTEFSVLDTFSAPGYTSSNNTSSSTGSSGGSTTYRPLAAVGNLFYPAS